MTDPSTPPWDDLHLAYFAGYAMWTYLTVPFLPAQPGFVAEELEPWQENGETRRRLRVKFPSHIASHSPEQVFHFGPDGLLRRHDYTPEVLIGDPGHLAVAHYANDHKRYDGISFPTRRRAIALNPTAQPCSTRSSSRSTSTTSQSSDPGERRPFWPLRQP